MFMVVVGCGPSDEQKQELRDAEAKLAPTITKLGAIRAALPSATDAKEIPCSVAIPKQSLGEISLGTLTYLLDDNEDTSRWERGRLAGPPFTKINSPTTNARLVKEADTLMGTIINYEHAAKELEPIENLVVFVPTTEDHGEIGNRDAKGSYQVVAPALWEGWVFVVPLSDQPEILMAFPTKQTSAPEMTFMKEKGKRPAKTLLIGNAADRVRQTALTRIAACPGGSPPD